MDFDALSDEILINILQFLDPKSIHQAAQTCQKFHQLSTDLPFWKHIGNNFGVEGDDIPSIKKSIKQVIHWGRISIKQQKFEGKGGTIQKIHQIGEEFIFTVSDRSDLIKWSIPLKSWKLIDYVPNLAASLDLTVREQSDRWKIHYQSQGFLSQVDKISNEVKFITLPIDEDNDFSTVKIYGVNLYVGTTCGELIVFELFNRTVLKRVKVSNGSISDIAIQDGKCYIATGWDQSLSQLSFIESE